MDTVQVSYGQYIFSQNPAAVTVKNRRTAVTDPASPPPWPLLHTTVAPLLL